MVGDEEHAMFVCPAFQQERDVLFSSLGIAQSGQPSIKRLFDVAAGVYGTVNGQRRKIGFGKLADFIMSMQIEC